MSGCKQYVLVAGGQWQKLVPGSLIIVQPSSQAYWRGVPVPQVLSFNETFNAAESPGTLLGVLRRPPVPAGANFGHPLAVLTIAVQGPAELTTEQHKALGQVLNTTSADNAHGWQNFARRRLLWHAEDKRITVL